MNNSIKNQTWTKQFKQPILISGPCSAESEEQLLETASQIDFSKVQIFRAGIWKPRTKPGSFEGVGEIGLKWLQKIKEKHNVLVATEIANRAHAKAALEHDIDVLWIGARTSVNPFMVQEIAEAIAGTDKIVLVKNPINPDLDLWIGALERLAAQNIKNLGVIHRGFSTYNKSKYRNKPQWQIPLELKKRFPNLPILTDPSHICGNREGLLDVSQTAFNLDFNGLMIESHCNPDKAWSDAKQQVTPNRLKEIIEQLDLRTEKCLDNLYQQNLKTLRAEIDELDNALIDILASRMKVAQRIGGLKADNNVAIFQANRWKTIFEHISKEAEKYNLSTEFVDQFYKAIHQESINQQNKMMTDKKK